MEYREELTNNLNIYYVPTWKIVVKLLQISKDDDNVVFVFVYFAFFIIINMIHKAQIIP